MKRLWMIALVVAVASGLVATPAYADAPALKITPLKYQEQVPLGKDKIGYVDISNPTNQTVLVQTEVQAFRQVGQKGGLEFYSDERISAGIVPELKEFSLGPREAIRLQFTIRPNVLGEGGAYGVIFGRTAPTTFGQNNANVAVSARVGTLMVLTIGKGGERRGTIEQVRTPRFAFGNSVTAETVYHNTGDTSRGLAFNPTLALKVGWFGKAQSHDGPLVLPGVTRDIEVQRSGSYLGLIPVQVTDQTGGGSSKTAWILACTGYWRWVLPLVLLVVGCGWYTWRRWVRPPRHTNS